MNAPIQSRPQTRRPEDGVWTVETSAAIIKFNGGTAEDFSGSESEPEPDVPSPTVKAVRGLKGSSGGTGSEVPSTLHNGIINQDSSRLEKKVVAVIPEPGHRLTIKPTSGDDQEQLQSVPGTGGVTRTERFNPFNRDMHMEEDYFENTSVDEQDHSDSYDVIDDVEADTISDDFLSETEEREAASVVTNAELGLAEDHFSRPEGTFGMTTVEELEMGIQNCKDLIMQTPEPSDRRKNLIHKLIQLRIKLIEAKEGPVEEEEDVKCVVGHRFKKRESTGSKHYCEKCGSVIWGVLQAWYKCTACGFCCHDKCLNLIYRTCANAKVKENPNYILSICPEKGLDSQNYRCAECSKALSFKPGFEEARRCDYTGSYYCRSCHWNDVMVLPARVIHNWDLEPRKVCRASKQFLRLMSTRACIRIQDINPMLFSLVEELNDVKKLREEILIMKKYFLSCQDALSSKLLLQLTGRQHFVDNSDIYSLQDLMDVASDILLPELAKIHSSFAQHIKTDCQLCQAKGYMCELCDMQEVLFPFDNIAIVCDRCSTVLHRHCFLRKNRVCPKCERMDRRAALLTELSEDAADT